MTIPRTHGVKLSLRKQISVADSWAETKRRLDTIQSALVAISEAVEFSRTLLRRRGPWDEARRNPSEYEPYRPYRHEDEMLNDLVNTAANNGSEEEQLAVRNAIIEYFRIRCALTLEPLGEPGTVDTLTLAVSAKKEVGEAESAALRALVTKCPEAHATAARETTEAISVLQLVRSALHLGSRRPQLRVAR